MSWYQAEPSVSAELVESLDLPREAAIIDIGGGASTLVDTLMAAGHRDLTVLDVSGAALNAARTHSSGLPVVRYDTNGLRDLFGIDFDVVASQRELHTTPGGVVQPFEWVVLRRRIEP